ncbi:hypothetical protein JCM8208_003658 [Rhodotorula glutinis]
MDDQVLISSSTSSSPSTSPPPLLRLSKELLDTIFTLAYSTAGNQSSTHRPICRRLLPFQRAQLYRCVKLRRYKALKLFHRTVMASHMIAELVRYLCISAWESNITNVKRGSGLDRSTYGDDEDDCKIVTPIEFAALVPRLSRLESLETDQLDPSLVDVVFLNQEASCRLASLETLEFGHLEVPVAEDDCDGDAWLRRLAGLPHLADLTLRQTHCDVPILPNMSIPPTFPHLTRLSLHTGMAQDWRWSGPALDQIAPGLVHLEFKDWHHDFVASALATAPVDLRQLSLVNTNEDDSDIIVRVPINKVLARFKNLEHLYLCRGVYDVSLPSGLADLLVLNKLVYLAFEDDGIVTDAFLLALLADPSHLPNLDVLELNHVRSDKGRTVASMQGALPPFVKRRQYPHWPMWDGWSEPEYPEGSSDTGLLQVRIAALQRDVHVEGTAVVASDWRSAFEAEQRVALLALGDLTGNYKRARPVVGVEAVNAHILARSLEYGEGGQGPEAGEA